MFNKTGVSFKIIKTASNLEGLKKTAATVIDSKDNEFLYFAAIALHADIHNGNFDLFPKDEIKKAYQTFIGTPININHDRNEVRGEIVEAFLVENSDTCYVEIIGKIKRSEWPELCTKIEEGKVNSVSMESLVEEASCPIPGCNCKAHNTEEFCDHLKALGKETEGKKHISVNTGLTFKGLALMDDILPADSDALILSHANKEEKKEKIDLEKQNLLQEISNETDINKILKKMDALEFLTFQNWVEKKVNPVKKEENKIVNVNEVIEDKHSKIKAFLKEKGVDVENPEAFIEATAEHKDDILKLFNIEPKKAEVKAEVKAEEVKVEEKKADEFKVGDVYKSKAPYKVEGEIVKIDGENIYLKPSEKGVSDMVYTKKELSDLIDKGVISKQSSKETPEQEYKRLADEFRSYKWDLKSPEMKRLVELEKQLKVKTEPQIESPIIQQSTKGITEGVYDWKEEAKATSFVTREIMKAEVKAESLTKQSATLAEKQVAKHLAGYKSYLKSQDFKEDLESDIRTDPMSYWSLLFDFLDDDGLEGLEPEVRKLKSTFMDIAKPLYDETMKTIKSKASLTKKAMQSDLTDSFVELQDGNIGFVQGYADRDERIVRVDIIKKVNNEYIWADVVVNVNQDQVKRELKSDEIPEMKDASLHLDGKKGAKAQSIIFDIKKWTEDKAKAWLKAHGYNMGNVDTTEKYHRFRQSEPSESKKYRIMDWGKGIKGIVEVNKKKANLEKKELPNMIKKEESLEKQSKIKGVSYNIEKKALKIDWDEFNGSISDELETSKEKEYVEYVRDILGEIGLEMSKAEEKQGWAHFRVNYINDFTESDSSLTKQSSFEDSVWIHNVLNTALTYAISGATSKAPKEVKRTVYEKAYEFFKPKASGLANKLIKKYDEEGIKNIFDDRVDENEVKVIVKELDIQGVVDQLIAEEVSKSRKELPEIETSLIKKVEEKKEVKKEESLTKQSSLEVEALNKKVAELENKFNETLKQKEIEIKASQDIIVAKEAELTKKEEELKLKNEQLTKKDETIKKVSSDLTQERVRRELKEKEQKCKEIVALMVERNMIKVNDELKSQALKGNEDVFEIEKRLLQDAADTKAADLMTKEMKVLELLQKEVSVIPVTERKAKLKVINIGEVERKDGRRTTWDVIIDKLSTSRKLKKQGE